MLLLVANEKDGITVRRPELVDEPCLHLILPIRLVPYPLRKGHYLPVHDGLGVAVASRRHAPMPVLGRGL